MFLTQDSDVASDPADLVYNGVALLGEVSLDSMSRMSSINL